MPVIDKVKHLQLMRQLKDRYEFLMDAFESRDLISPTEGCKGRGHWINPESKCATIGDEVKLRMRVEDFKTILAEIKRLR